VTRGCPPPRRPPHHFSAHNSPDTLIDVPREDA